MFSTSVQLQTKSKTTHIVATCFLQLLINNVVEYKLRMKFSQKGMARANTIAIAITCHYLPI